MQISSWKVHQAKIYFFVVFSLAVGIFTAIEYKDFSWLAATWIIVILCSEGVIT